MTKNNPKDQTTILELLPTLLDDEFEEIRQVITAIQILRRSYGFFEINSL